MIHVVLGVAHGKIICPRSCTWIATGKKYYVIVIDILQLLVAHGLTLRKKVDSWINAMIHACPGVSCGLQQDSKVQEVTKISLVASGFKMQLRFF
jgi:hypothetical protein